VACLLLNANLGTASETANWRLAVHLIGSVDAVVLSIAAEGLRDTIVVFALELIVSALGQRRTHSIRFILVLPTIIDAVTERRVADTQLVAALKGVCMAMGFGTGLQALVTAVQAVIPSIALPAGHDALAVSAAKVIRMASTVHLVRPIRAVIITIAFVLPAKRNF